MNMYSLSVPIHLHAFISLGDDQATSYEAEILKQFLETRGSEVRLQKRHTDRE